MKQQFEQYTAEDLAVWSALFERQIENLEHKASHDYLEALQSMSPVLNPYQLPHFEKINEWFSTRTGWEIACVPGLIEVDEFFELLSEKKFPSSTWLRSKDKLDYLEEPDMFHDTFGHVPLLSNAAFCTFMSHLSTIALRFIDQEEALQRISRLYWYTVEFGLIYEHNTLKIYGGGIISSSGESHYCLSNEVPKIDFDLERVLNTPYHIDRYQDHYFVIDSYEQLYQSISRMEDLLVAYS